MLSPHQQTSLSISFPQRGHTTDSTIERQTDRILSHQSFSESPSACGVRPF